MGSREFSVTCLCAEWCGVCRDYREGFLAMARRFPQASFAWTDVEEEELELDVENFPTIVVKRGEETLFSGPMPPQHGNLERLLEKLLAT